MFTVRPPLTTAFTLPLIKPSPSKTLTILSQFCLWAAFSLDRTTIPSSFSSFSSSTSTSSPTSTSPMSSNSEAGDHPFGFIPDVHQNLPRPDFQYTAFYDAAFFEIAQGLRD